MRQIVLARRGGPTGLELRPAPDPAPAAGEVRIRTRLAGVNFADVMARLGLHPDAPRPPCIPGYEVMGTIDAVGSGVDSRRLGRRVVALCNGGGYSELVCVPQALVFAVADNVTDEAAAALPLNYVTAYLMLRVLAPVQAGEYVLVHSAAGGVGQAACQLTTLAGGIVLASAAPAKHGFLLAQGAALVLDSQEPGFAGAVRSATGGRGADIALEPRHGRWVLESYRSLAKGGRLVLHGFSSAATSRPGTLSALRTLAAVPWLRLNPLALMNDNKAVGGVNLARMWSESERLGTWLRTLLDWLSAGAVTPTIDCIYPAAAAGDAQLRLQQRANIGKVLLDFRDGGQA